MLQGHGGESVQPFPASVLALWLFELTWSFATAEAASADGGTRSAAPGSLCLIRRCGPDGAPGSGLLNLGRGM